MVTTKQPRVLCSSLSDTTSGGRFVRCHGSQRQKDIDLCWGIYPITVKWRINVEKIKNRCKSSDRGAIRILSTVRSPKENKVRSKPDDSYGPMFLGVRTLNCHQLENAVIRFEIRNNQIAEFNQTKLTKKEKKFKL